MSTVIFCALLVVAFWLLNWKLKWPEDFATWHGKPIPLWMANIFLVVVFFGVILQALKIIK